MFVFCLVFLASYASAAIIPEELPSLLSVAYSNIPPIKKGTDSRVGFGFSLGNHADFQVMFELGPQTNTRPIGSSFASSSKRHTPNKVEKVAQHKQRVSSEGDTYLNSWSQTMKQKPYQPLPIPGDYPQMGLNEEHIKGALEGGGVLTQPAPELPKQQLKQLMQLYGDKAVMGGSEDDLSRDEQVALERQLLLKLLEQRDQEKKIKNEERKRQVTKELADVSLDDE